MKSINAYINESAPLQNYGSKFAHEVKYSKADWDKWRKLIKKEEWGKDVLIGSYDSAPELTVVYKAGQGNAGTDQKNFMDHIASYNSKEEILYCDDINLFGNGVK